MKKIIFLAAAAIATLASCTKTVIEEQGPAAQVIGNPQMERTKQFLSSYTK